MLVVAPIMKKTDIVSSLVDSLPSLSTSSPHDLSIPELPELKSLVLIDNCSGRPSAAGMSFEETLRRVKGAVDYREMLVWNRSAMDEVKEAEKALPHQDVVNLQFSACVRVHLTYGPITESCRLQRAVQQVSQKPSR